MKINLTVDIVDQDGEDDMGGVHPSILTASLCHRLCEITFEAGQRDFYVDDANEYEDG